MLSSRIDASFAELDVDATDLLDEVVRLSDSSVREAFNAAARLARHVQTLEAALAGVIAQRSTRAAGPSRRAAASALPSRRCKSSPAPLEAKRCGSCGWALPSSRRVERMPRLLARSFLGV